MAGLGLDVSIVKSVATLVWLCPTPLSLCCCPREGERRACTCVFVLVLSIERGWGVAVF